MEGIDQLPPMVGDSGYQYVLLDLKIIQVTRKGLQTAASACSLTYIVFQGSSLCLTTTPLEALAASVRWFLTPLKWLRLPRDEIVLSLLLALRFVDLVFEELRSSALAVLSRGVSWPALRPLETLDILIQLASRLFNNLLRQVCNAWKLILMKI